MVTKGHTYLNKPAAAAAACLSMCDLFVTTRHSRVNKSAFENGVGDGDDMIILL